MNKLIAAVTVAMLLAGCNTVNGIGKDLAQAGNAIKRSASKHESNSQSASDKT